MHPKHVLQQGMYGLHVHNQYSVCKNRERFTATESCFESWGMRTYARRENIHEDSSMSLEEAKAEAQELSRTRLLRRWSSHWHYLVTTDCWEAVFLLALYFILRWDERLRGISVVMLSSSVISLIVLLSFRKGAQHFRIRVWLDIARKSYSIGQYNLLFGPHLKLVGMDTYLLCRPFLPLYILLFPFGIAFAMWFYPVYDEDTSHPFWQKVGSFVFHLLGKPCLRRVFPGEIDGQEAALNSEQCVERNEKQDSQATNGFVRSVFGVEGVLQNKDLIFSAQHTATLPTTVPLDNATHEEQDEGLRGRIGTVFLLNCFVSVLVHVLRFIALLLLFLCIVVIAVVAFLFAIPIALITLLCVLLLFAAGNHVAIFFVVSIETVATLCKVDLGGDWRIELCAGLSFVIPLGMCANEIFFDWLLLAVLAAMRRDLGRDHRLSKLSLIFSSIPVDGSQGELKIYKSSETRDETQIPDRPKSLHYMMSVREPELDELRLRFFHTDPEDFTSRHGLTMHDVEEWFHGRF